MTVENHIAAGAAGRFITFEGIDGAGKSSHIEALAEWTRARGAEVVLAREPGGTVLAEKLRALFLHDAMDALTEALLVFLAARRVHLREVIEPCAGTLAQSCCAIDAPIRRPLPIKAPAAASTSPCWRKLEDLGAARPTTRPDAEFDRRARRGRPRRAAVRSADRFEREDEAFFARVRDGYAQRAHAAPARFARIDAAQTREAVREGRVLRALASRGWFPELDGDR